MQDGAVDPLAGVQLDMSEMFLLMPLLASVWEPLTFFFLPPNVESVWKIMAEGISLPANPAFKSQRT